MFSNATMHPLLLPELLSLVLDYIEPEDRPSCSLVCWTWYSNFNPLVWDTCTVDPSPSPISVQAVKKNAQFIHTLVIRGLVAPDYFTAQYPNLHTLKMQCRHMLLGDSGIDNDTVNQMWRGAATLINRSPSLSTIDIAAQRYSIANEIWEAIQNSPKVKTLVLSHVKINAEQSPNFWKACTVLEKLDLDACLFTTVPTTSHFPLLKDVRFGNLAGITPENQIHIMSLCPELKSIFWHGGMPISAIHRFTIGIVDRGEFKKLDSLDLTGLFVRDDDLRRVIKHMKQPIKRLALVQTGFGPSSLTALEPHFHVIQELNLVDCLEISSKNIARLLRSCPLLVSFKAGELSSLDVKEDESWPCSDRLLTLLVNIQLAEDDVQEASRRVFACLSKLTSLRLLNIAKYTSVMGGSQKSGRPLQLRLDCGLSLLSTLRYLELLVFDRSGQSMTMEEGIWIKTNWKRLVAIGGKFNDNNEQDTQIRSLFQDKNSRYDRRRLKA